MEAQQFVSCELQFDQSFSCELLVNGFHLLTTFAKSFILDVWQSSEYASGVNNQSLWVDSCISLHNVKSSLLVYIISSLHLRQ